MERDSFVPVLSLNSTFTEICIISFLQRGTRLRAGGVLAHPEQEDCGGHPAAPALLTHVLEKCPSYEVTITRAHGWLHSHPKLHSQTPGAQDRGSHNHCTANSPENQ